MQSLITLAKGDMRKALNILQVSKFLDYSYMSASVLNKSKSFVVFTDYLVTTKLFQQTDG